MTSPADASSASTLARLTVPLTRRRLLVAAAVPWVWFIVRDLPHRWGLPWVWRLADLAAYVLPVAALVVALLAVVVGRPRVTAAVVTVSWLVFGAVATVGPWRSQAQPGPVDGISIAFANLLLTNVDPSVASRLAELDVDVIITTETNGDQYRELVERLGPPAAVGGDEAACTLIGPGDCTSLNVWSRLPVSVEGDQSAANTARGLRLVVTPPAGDPIAIYAVHPAAPSPFGVGAGRSSFVAHRHAIEALRDALLDDERPAVLVGDLNLSDRQPGYRHLTRELRDAMRVERVGPTSLKSYLRPLLLRIDHLLVTPDLCSRDARRFTVPGSDHRGVTATVGRCR